MSQKLRIGNTYYHRPRDEEVIIVNKDHQNEVWFRGVTSKDNAGVIATSDWMEHQPYKEFLGSVEMRDYPEDWSELRQVVLERDNHRCQGCGNGIVDADEHHVHHIVPLGCGGTNTLRNLITLCDECHGRIHGGPI